MDAVDGERLTAPADVGWALAQLRPPTSSQLRLAQRVGLDPNVLLEHFRDQYDAAVDADAATIDKLATDRQSRLELWDHVNQIAEERRHEWWVAPVQEVARLLNPRATSRDLEGIAHRIRSSGRVGFIVASTSEGSSSACPIAGSARRAREHRPRVARRTSSSSTTSSSDPGGEPSGEPEPPRRRYVVDDHYVVVAVVA